MNRSLWTIVTMGFMCIVTMVILMLFSLSTYQGTAAGNRVRLANMIQEEFGFPESGAGVKDVEGRLILRVEYLSHNDSKFDDKFMSEEMNRVADFARQRYDGRDRRSIAGVRVRRVEIQGKGCWRTTLDRELAVDGPLGAATRPTPQEPPQEEK